jgi:hypothetical protein
MADTERVRDIDMLAVRSESDPLGNGASRCAPQRMNEYTQEFLASIAGLNQGCIS